jgi:hypothetical protein
MAVHGSRVCVVNGLTTIAHAAHGDGRLVSVTAQALEYADLPQTERSPYVTPTATLPSEAWTVALIQPSRDRQGRDSRPRRGSLYGLAGSSLLAWLTWLIT